MFAVAVNYFKLHLTASRTTLNFYMKFFFGLILLCLVFASCNKKGTVTGVVTNLFDNTPIEGQELRIDYTNNNALNWKHGDAAQAFSDSKGEFQMAVDFKYSKRMHYT